MCTHENKRRKLGRGGGAGSILSRACDIGVDVGQNGPPTLREASTLLKSLFSNLFSASLSIYRS